MSPPRDFVLITLALTGTAVALGLHFFRGAYPMSQAPGQRVPCQRFELQLDRFSSQQLDRTGHIWHIDQFLTEEEVNHFRTIGAGSAKMMSSASYGAVEFRRPWESSADQVALQVEDRISALTSIAPNRNDSPLRMAVNREWAGELDNSSTNQLQNLHHDKLRAPERVVTVLIYLSDAAADGLSGGDTLFPCARTATDAPPSALCRRLERAYADGDLFLSPPNGIYKSIECFDTAAAGAASLLCSVGGTGDEWDSMLRVSPARGSAVVFLQESTEPDAADLWHMWHGGCRVTNGEKWTMQQFKALPT